MDASAKFVCKVDAIPVADIKWYKDYKPLKTDENIKISTDKSELIIHKMKPEYSGRYMCAVKNLHEKRGLQFHIGISGIGMFTEQCNIYMKVMDSYVAEFYRSDLFYSELMNIYIKMYTCAAI